MEIKKVGCFYFSLPYFALFYFMRRYAQQQRSAVFSDRTSGYIKVAHPLSPSLPFFHLCSLRG